MLVAAPTCPRFSLDVRVVDIYSVVQQVYGWKKYSLVLQDKSGQGGDKESWMGKLVLAGCQYGGERYVDHRADCPVASCVVRGSLSHGNADSEILDRKTSIDFRKC